MYEEETPRAPQVVFELGVPVLGICYGMQTMAAQLGGKVENAAKREFGYAEMRAHGHSALLRDIQDRVNDEGHGLLDVWMSHGDKVTALPPGFKVIGFQRRHADRRAWPTKTRRFYGVQFHPEVTHTLQGKTILRPLRARHVRLRQATGTCRITSTRPSAAMRSEVGSDEVILGLVRRRRFLGGGGAAASRHRHAAHLRVRGQRPAAPERGRAGDADLCRQSRRQGHPRRCQRPISWTHLAGVTDPEQKRKIIGREFVEVFQEEAEKLPNAKWLAQGTIYPDVIESASAKTKKAHTIKSHHNVGGLPDTLHLKLLEPLRELFKDEVRELGVALGLPHDMVYRHPFPGPGLGVRILGEVKREYADLLRRADAIFIEELRASGWYEKTSQAFAVFLPVKVGRRDGRRPHLRLRRCAARRAVTRIS